MKKLAKLGLTLGLSLLMTLAMATMALAVGVPDAVYTMPGVPQLVGIPDKPYNQFTVAECRSCHLSDDQLTTANLHHNTPTALSPGCVACHPVDPTTNELVTGDGFDRTCTRCHTKSWHHENPRAVGGKCTFCHDSKIIADVGTGWVAPNAPTYQITDVTPRTIDCNNCHIEFKPTWDGKDGFYSPNGTSHHATVKECTFCHDSDIPRFAAAIRACEGCHTITTLHTIKGHTEGGVAGMNNSERCLGCHGAYMKNLPEGDFQPLAPNVTSVSKSVAKPYDYIDVVGDNFGSKVDGIKAQFIKYNTLGLPSVYDAPVVNVSLTEMQVMVPMVAELGNYDLVVSNASGQTGAGTVVSITNTPIITQLNPAVAKAGDKLVISGSYLNNNGTPKVKIAKFQDPAPYILTPAFVDGNLEVTIPAAAKGTYNVSVINDMGESNLMNLTIGTAPRITSIYPTATTVGKSVTISGSNLMIGKTKPNVTIGGVPVTKFGSASSTRIMVFVPTMPKGATTISLSNAYGTSNSVAFTVR